MSQDLSQFALHVRAILGLPIPQIQQRGATASAVILVEGDGSAPQFQGLPDALAEAGTDLRLFGKPEVIGRRRMGVCLARDVDVDAARTKARQAAAKIVATTSTGEPWPPQ